MGTSIVSISGIDGDRSRSSENRERRGGVIAVTASAAVAADVLLLAREGLGGDVGMKTVFAVVSVEEGIHNPSPQLVVVVVLVVTSRPVSASLAMVAVVATVTLDSASIRLHSMPFKLSSGCSPLPILLRTRNCIGNGEESDLDGGRR